MSPIREIVSPPAQVQRVELGRSYRFKRRRNRQIYVVRFDDMQRDVATIRPRLSRHSRVIPRTKLVEDFDQVERCGRCGWHHKLTDMPIERCVR